MEDYDLEAGFLFSQLPTAASSTHPVCGVWPDHQALLQENALQCPPVSAAERSTMQCRVYTALKHVAESPADCPTVC